MTRERDIERVLDAWFEPGPTEMPDRLFDDILARVDRVPQRRALPNLRFFTMDSRIRWLALAAAALVVVVGGLALINRPDQDVGTSPTPSSSSSGSADPSALPAELFGQWMGEHKSSPFIELGAGTTLAFTFGSVWMTQSNRSDEHHLVSTAGGTGPNRIQTSSSADADGCSTGDSGDYSWSLSPGGRVLTISNASDDCSARSTAFEGTWWKMDCPAADDGCLGDVEPGTYSSQYFDPFLAPGSSWRPRFGALEYTVPDGWSNTADWPDVILFAPQGAASAEIALYRDPVPHAQGEGQCTETAEPGVGRDAVSYAEFLAGLPGLVPTTAEPISIGGLDGRTVDLEVNTGWTADCPYSAGVPMVSTVTDLSPEPGLDWNIPAGAKARYILLDLGGDRALLIKIEAATKAEFDTYVDDAMTVIQTFQFNR